MLAPRLVSSGSLVEDPLNSLQILNREFCRAIVALESLYRGNAYPSDERLSVFYSI